LPAKSRRH